MLAMKFIIILLFALNLYAQTTYIIVTKVSNKEQLAEVYSKFTSLNLKMLYKQSAGKYTIYSGPYKTSKDTKSALRRLKRYFTHARISQASEKTREKPVDKPLQESPEVTLDTQKKEEKKDSGFYIGLATGYASAPSSHIIESGSVTIQAPNTSGIALSAMGGYNFQSGFSLGLGYMSFDAKDIVFENLYMDLNYRFKEFDTFVPYFGVLAGYSSLIWNTSPIPSPQANSNNNSDSFFGGSQVGILYKGLPYISLFGVYQCMFMQHTTNINSSTSTVSNTSTLQHNTLHSLQFGINYNF
jgi:hypothetical protein